MDKTLLKKLMQMPGLPGEEYKVAETIRQEAEELNFEIITDNLGSTFAVKKSKKKDAPKMMIDAHMDEVGFTVMSVEKNGLIRFEEKGGIWKHSLAYQRMRVWDMKLENSFSGVVTFNRPPLPQSAPSPLPNIDKLHIDIGAKTAKEVKEWGIHPGSTITFDTQIDENGDRIIGKAVDNRAGVSLMIETMRYLSSQELDYDVYIGGTVQEENGLKGARTMTYKIKPDIAAVIDISPAKDIPVSIGKGTIGKGTFIRHKDAYTIYPKIVTTYLEDLFKSEKIKYQHYFSDGGTNAGMVHTSREGVITFPFGFLARNLHIGSTVMDMNDYEETLKALKAFLNKMDAKTIKGLKV